LAERPRNRPSDGEPDVDKLAGAILDGEAVDWPAVGPLIGDDSVTEFRVLEALADVHRRAALTGRQTAEPVPVGVGHWRGLTLLERVGQGSFGTVYRAWDSSLHRQVALKLVPESTLASSASSAIHEARLLARVTHPHVLTVYGADRTDGQVGIWTELITGQTLDALIRAHGPMLPEAVASIGADLCSALSAVHGANLLHRDVKAQNVMRESGGRIVLMDFGAGFDLVQPTRTGDLTGTPLYLAPEIVDGGRATVASDLYAVAVLLFHLLTGDYPTSGRTLAEVRQAQVGGQVRRLRDLRAGVPDALAAVVERGLSVPSERPASAREFELALRATARGAQPKRARWSSRGALVSVATAAIVSAAVWTSVLPSRPNGVDRIQFPKVAQATVGRPSGDGRFVAYVDGERNLAIFEAATGQHHPVTVAVDAHEGAGLSVMSRSGDRAAYEWMMPNGGFELRVVNADGTWAHTIIARESAFEPIPRDWSRDGRWIVCWFNRRVGTSDLMLVPVDGGAPKRLLSQPAGAHGATRAPISPDGRFVAFFSSVGCGTIPSSGHDLCVVGTDGATPGLLAPLPDGGADPSWTPDGAGVMFIRNPQRPGDTTEAWAVPVVGGRAAGAPRRVAANLGAMDAPTLTDRGALMWEHFGLARQLNVVSVDLDHGGLGAPARVSNNEIRDHSGGVWSPDGEKLAYFTGRPSSDGLKEFVGTLTVSDRRTAVERELPIPLPFLTLYPPTFVPRRDAVIVWGGDLEQLERFGFYQVDYVTGQTALVALRPRLANHTATFAASLDGRSLLYVDDDRGLVSLDLSNGSESVRAPLQSGEAMISFAEAPKGAKVAIVVTSRDLTRTLTLVENGRRHDLVLGHEEDLGVVGWSPGGENIVFTRFPIGGMNRETPLQLWSVPATGGSPTDLRGSILTGRGARVALSPNGQSLLYTETGPVYELFVRPGFLTSVGDILRHPLAPTR
jgi:serine/threonine-protein kinase